MEPEIIPGVESEERTHEQTEPVLPHALPPNTQMLHPEAPPAGSETKVTLTFGVVVWYGPGFPLKSTPLWLHDQL